MQYIRREHFLHCVGLSASSYDVMATKDHVALAFGLPIPAVAGHYLPLDVVAMRIANGLTKSVGRDYASAIVLTHFDVWADAVGRTDFDDQEMFFVVGIKDGKNPDFLVTGGTREEINRDFQDLMFTHDRTVKISITNLVTYIRERARGVPYLDLSAPFYLPPGHQDYERLLAEAQQEREGRLERLRRDKKKWARHTRRQDGMKKMAKPAVLHS